MGGGSGGESQGHLVMDSRGVRKPACGEGLAEERGSGLGSSQAVSVLSVQWGPEEWMQLPGKASDPGSLARGLGEGCLA